MKSNGITLTSSPQNGSVTINYDELEASNAKRFVTLYIDAEAPEYDGDLSGEELPESILAAAIAFNRALQVLQFVPEMSVQWLIDNVPGVYEETVRRYAVEALGMERVDPVAAARERMIARRTAAGQFGKEAQLGAAIDAFVAEGEPDELGRAIYEHSSLSSEQFGDLVGDMACWHDGLAMDEPDNEAA